MIKTGSTDKTLPALRCFTGLSRTKRFAFSKRSNRPTQTKSDDYAKWLKANFPHVCTAPLSERHHRLWQWFESLAPGSSPPPRVEPWPRGGAKSSTGELGCARLCVKGTKKFVLYVSGTQDQADSHVQSVSSLLEHLGIERSISKYGHSKGWRRNQLRAANGFNVAAYGLDVAARGVKIDQYRPDLIIFDDIDSQDDSPKTVEKKERAIKSAILPAGSPDVAILFLQNLIHEESIVSKLCDDRADFLLHREVPKIEVAVEDLQVEAVDRGDGRKVWKVVSGVPTWEGQNIEVCERQINDWGLATFRREAQHEVHGADGFFFDYTKFGHVDQAPADLRRCIAWDLAATENGGDYTVGVLMGIAPNGVVYVLNVVRRQIASEKVRALVLEWCVESRKTHGTFGVRLPQDPGQAGKDQAGQYRKLLVGFDPTILPVTGSKAKRAEGWAEQVNSGNVKLVKADWNHWFEQEHRKFRADEEHEFDDQVDAAADAFNHLFKKKDRWQGRTT